MKSIKGDEKLNKVKLHAELCKQLNTIYEQKNSDYGDSFAKSLNEYGMVMPCIRLDDKLNRLKSLTRGNTRKVKDESVKDTLMDLANYAIITIIEMEMEPESEHTSKWIWKLKLMWKWIWKGDK